MGCENPGSAGEDERGAQRFRQLSTKAFRAPFGMTLGSREIGEDRGGFCHSAYQGLPGEVCGATGPVGNRRGARWSVDPISTSVALRSRPNQTWLSSPPAPCCSRTADSKSPPPRGGGRRANSTQREGLRTKLSGGPSSYEPRAALLFNWQVNKDTSRLDGDDPIVISCYVRA